MELLLEAKKIYDKYLLNKDFLYIYIDSVTKKIKYIEMKCRNRNFLHLTGVKTHIKAKDFYKNLNKERISLEDIDYRSNGTTRLKLEVFERIPLLFTSAVQICFQDDFFTLKLQVDLLINQPVRNRKDIVLGLKQQQNFDFFVPASLLKEEPQKIGKNFSRVLGILEKNEKDKKYYNIKYKAKDIDIPKIMDELVCELLEK